MVTQYISFEVNIYKDVVFNLVIRLTLVKTKDELFVNKAQPGGYTLKKGETVLDEGDMSLNELGEDLQPVLKELVDSHLRMLEMKCWSDAQEAQNWLENNRVEDVKEDNVVKFRKPA
jgi:hypothetical protein